MILIAIVTM